MQPKYEYRRRLPHYQKDNHPLFVTFTTDRRWQLPPEPATLLSSAGSKRAAASSSYMLPS